MKDTLKKLNNLHRSSDSRADVFIFGTARSGTTLMHEMVTSQTGFKPVKVPFDLRYKPIAKYMRERGIKGWSDYYSEYATLVIKEYITGIQTGKIHISDPYFFKNYNRWMTDRIVFKILHSCEDRLQWFQETFGGHIIYMLRHPIPVAFSRRQIPRLETFLTSRYRRFFSRAQLSYANGIVQNGTHMQRAVLDWALQNAVSLNYMAQDATIISYEQLVVDPDPIVKTLCSRLNLSDPDAIKDRLTNPSYSSKWSDEETNSILNKMKSSGSSSDASTQDWLIFDKWKNRLGQGEEELLMEILDVFELDTYQVGSPHPHERYLIDSSTGLNKVA